MQFATLEEAKWNSYEQCTFHRTREYMFFIDKILYKFNLQ